MPAQRPYFGLWPALPQVGQFQGWFSFDGATGAVGFDSNAIVAGVVVDSPGRYTVTFNAVPDFGASNPGALFAQAFAVAGIYIPRSVVAPPNLGIIAFDDNTGAPAAPSSVIAMLFTGAN